MAREDVFLPFDANEYRAVVNPTGLVLQTAAYGRRFVFVPEELNDPRRAPVQMMKTRIARKAVKNQRRFLEIMSIEQGFKLMKLARKLGNFAEAYRRITGRSGRKAGELLMDRQERQSLRRALIHSVGIPEDMMTNWTTGDMRAVLRDNTLAADVDDATGRPRLDVKRRGYGEESVFEISERVDRELPSELKNDNMADFLPVDGDGPKRPIDGTKRIPERGLPGDFVGFDDLSDEQIEALSNAEADTANFRTPEEVAAAATAEYDAKHGGIVKGEVPVTVAAQQRGFKGLAVGDEIVKDLRSDVDIVPPKPKAGSGVSNDRENVVALRQQIERLGGKWHPRSGVAKLQSDLDSLMSEAVSAEAAVAAD